MKKSILVFVLLIALVLPFAVYAQSFDQLVQQLQENPDDAALREQIIKLAQEKDSTIPEEARRNFVQGTTIAKDAKDAGGQRLAVESFKNALKIAPWWGDAYYNLAVAQELAGSYGDARSSLGFYILTNPGEKEAREAQDRVYALEAKEKLKQAEKKSTAEEEVKKPVAQEKSIDGLRCVIPFTYPAGVFEKGYEVRGNEVVSITILAQIFDSSQLGTLTQVGQISINNNHLLQGDTFDAGHGNIGKFSSDRAFLTVSGSDNLLYPCK